LIHSLHILGSRQFGGAEHFFGRLLCALNQEGHTAAAVIRPSSPMVGSLNGSIRKFHIPMRNGWDLPSLLRIRGLVKEIRPAIVQTYMGRASRLTRVPKNSLSVHVARLGGYYKIDGYYRHAHAWVGNSRGLCDYLIRQGLPPNRVYRIGNFVEPKPPSDSSSLNALRNSLDIPKEAIVIFSLGRFIKGKGMRVLLEAMARMPHTIKQDRPLFLVIAGDGPLKTTLYELAATLGLDRHLRWVGWQDDPTPYYHLGDIFVCPSRHETLGNVILEAWAYGLPVVSTQTPGALELIVHGENGMLTPSHQPQALADQLINLIRSGPDLWQDLIRNGIHTLAKNHSREAVVKAYLDMYEELQDKQV